MQLRCYLCERMDILRKPPSTPMDLGFHAIFKVVLLNGFNPDTTYSSA